MIGRWGTDSAYGDTGFGERRADRNPKFNCRQCAIFVTFQPMEITQLRYFAYVAKLCSFTVASQRLSVAQSALSRQVKALEDEFDVLLLSRSPHSVRPTEAGLRLLETRDRSEERSGGTEWVSKCKSRGAR